MITMKYDPILGVSYNYDGERPEAPLISTVNPRQYAERFNTVRKQRTRTALIPHNLKKK